MEESNFLEQSFERRGGFQQVETSGKPFQNGRKALRKGVGAYLTKKPKVFQFPIHTVQIDSLQSTFHLGVSYEWHCNLEKHQICYIQNPVISFCNHNGKEYKMNVYVCIMESLCCISEINPTLSINYTSIKKLGKKLKNIRSGFGSQLCHQLCSHGQVTLPHCAQVSHLLNWTNKST